MRVVCEAKQVEVEQLVREIKAEVEEIGWEEEEPLFFIASYDLDQPEQERNSDTFDYGLLNRVIEGVFSGDARHILRSTWLILFDGDVRALREIFEIIIKKVCKFQKIKKLLHIAVGGLTEIDGKPNFGWTPGTWGQVKRAIERQHRERYGL